MPEDVILHDLEEEIQKLRAIAEISVEPCIVAQAIAVSAAEVKDKLVSRLQNGKILRGSYCIGRQWPQEHQNVIFEFEAPPGKLYLLRDAILAVVDVRSASVIKLIDPYVPGTGLELPILSTPGGELPFVAAVPSNAQNVVPDQNVIRQNQQQEINFLESKGLLPTFNSIVQPFTTNCTCPIGCVQPGTTQTPIGTESYSNGRTDDTTTDYQGDQDVITDNVLDVRDD